MATVWIILSCLLWAASVWCMWGKQLLAPAFSYIGLSALSMAQSDGLSLLPINAPMLIWWLSFTVLTMLTTLLCPEGIRQQRRGTIQMIIGAFAGMAVGLIGSSMKLSPAAAYAMMIIGTAAGVFFGYMVFARSTAGRAVSIGSGNFFRYFPAKAFPIAVSVMIIGMVLVLLIALHNASASL